MPFSGICSENIGFLKIIGNIGDFFLKYRRIPPVPKNIGGIGRYTGITGNTGGRARPG